MVRRFAPGLFLLQLLVSLVVLVGNPSSGGAAASASMSLGTFAVISDSSQGAVRTVEFTVSCSGVSAGARGALEIRTGTGRPRGLVMFFSGGGGNELWSRRQGVAERFLAGLRSAGLTTVQAYWRDPWLKAPAGEQIGPGALACRPATTIRWAYDHLYQGPATVSERGAAPCGFCVTGNSGGASQVSYTLSRYGLEPLLDAVVPTSGPPHAALAKGCLRNETQRAYWYSTSNARRIDSSYGFLRGGGACERREARFAPRWLADSVDAAGADFFHPSTRVHLILGSRDNGAAPPHALDYLARLAAARLPFIGKQVVDGMGHSLPASQAGLEALRRVLLRAAKCRGRTATILGTPERDLLRGSPRRDVIAGAGGADRIFGLGGNDLLCGQQGPDLLVGGKGADLLSGGPGNDRLFGGPGRDRLLGGPGRDTERQ